jgi:hypothetical protein
LLSIGGPAPASAGTAAEYEVVTIAVTSVSAPTSVVSTLRAAGPAGESLLCDRFYAFGDQAGEFTLQHRCGSTTAPWGYQIAPQLRAIAITPVTEQGVDWTRNGVKQSRLSPHVEAADYIFHGTFPGSPDGTTITYSDHYSFRHGAGGGGNVDISIKGAFTLTGNRA